MWWMGIEDYSSVPKRHYHAKTTLPRHCDVIMPLSLYVMCPLVETIITGDPLHSRAACTQPCNVNTHSRAHCSPGARLCEQWGHGCVNNGARLCASARLCRGSPVIIFYMVSWNVATEVYWGRIVEPQLERNRKPGSALPVDKLSMSVILFITTCLKGRLITKMEAQWSPQSPFSTRYTLSAKGGIWRT